MVARWVPKVMGRNLAYLSLSVSQVVVVGIRGLRRVVQQDHVVLNVTAQPSEDDVLALDKMQLICDRQERTLTCQ